MTTTMNPGPAGAMAEPGRPYGCERCEGSGYIAVADARRGARAAACKCLDHCTLCRGRGYIETKDETTGYRMTKPCDCRQVRARVAAFNAAAIPPVYFDKTLANFRLEVPSQVQAAKRLSAWLQAFGRGVSPGIVLSGGTGTGKTHLLCALLRELTLGRGIGALYREFFLLMSEIRQLDRRQANPGELIRPLIDVEVLALDEVGKGANTEWDQAVLDQIISERYNRGRTTLFATNYPMTVAQLARRLGLEPDELQARQRLPVDRFSPEGREKFAGAMLTELFQDRIGSRIFSRILETCVILELEGPDFRELLHRGVAKRGKRPAA